jgi:hypothetical protein
MGLNGSTQSISLAVCDGLSFLNAEKICLFSFSIASTVVRNASLQGVALMCRSVSIIYNDFPYATR